LEDRKAQQKRKKNPEEKGIKEEKKMGPKT